MKTSLLSALAILLALNLSAATPEFNATVAIDGSGDYTSVQAAVDAAPAGRTSPWRIFIENGFYRETVTIPAEKPFIHLIGEDREWTRIHEKIHVGGRPASGRQTYGWQFSNNNPGSVVHRRNDTGAVVAVHADDFYAENISFVNDWGVDEKTGPQAIALLTYGNRAAFHHCAMRSYQDTWKTPKIHTHVGYARDCLIEGAVDYIYGTGNYFFDSCTIRVVRDGAVIVAPNHNDEVKWGYVFNACTIDGQNARGEIATKTYFGRPWHNNPVAVWLDTRILVEMAPEGWQDMGGWPRAFSEWHSHDTWGNNIDTSNRKTSYRGRDDKNKVVEVTNSVLTDAQAAQFTYENVLSGWDPRSYIAE